MKGCKLASSGVCSIVYSTITHGIALFFSYRHRLLNTNLFEDRNSFTLRFQPGTHSNKLFIQRFKQSLILGRQLMFARRCPSVLVTLGYSC